MEIIISDRQDSRPEKKFIEEVGLRVLEKEMAKEDTELSISLVKPGEMRELNKKWRGIDKPTDVLSFSLKEPSDNLIGDVVICPEEGRTRAKEQGEDFKKYLALLIIHGTLHLLGYNHEIDAEAKVMSGREEQLLEELGLLEANG